MAKTKRKTDTQTQTLSFNAEVGKVLQLMIHSLYTNRDIFLRELISNASDACDKLRYEALSDDSLMAGDGDLGITLSIDKPQRVLIVADNGIGMNREEMIENLGTIARSGTQAFLEKLTGNKEHDMALIGQFGVGFYSSFMVAEKVEVISRRAGEEQAWRWISDGMGDFTIEPWSETVGRGTRIMVHLKPGEDAYLDKHRIQHVVKTYSDHISFPILLIDEEGRETRVNEGSALWMRPKSDVTAEQYKEFYHHVAHSLDEPWMTLHSKVEGTIEYNSLLFIPTKRPFDLFHPDRRRRVKLYVKRVFITDENVDIIPHYLRFLRGVVDSEDLPLNISRETLQANPVIDKIRNSLVSRILSELKKKAEAEPESFARFWENFGPAFKEGLCEHMETKEREKMLEVCRFYSSKAEGLVSLDDYIARMQEGQEEIYFITGDTLEALRNSPKIGGFTKRGIEVLLLNDHVDDFWVNVVPDFKGKEMKSVTRTDIDLDRFGKDEAKDEAKDDTPETPEAKEKMDALVAYLASLYGEEIRDVRTTSKLADSPVCLAIEAGMMDIRMERFLMEHKQLAEKSAKIMEINPEHPVIRRLANMVEADKNSEALSEAAWLLLDQAKIIEGEDIADPNAFSRRLNLFLGKGLAA